MSRPTREEMAPDLSSRDAVMMHLRKVSDGLRMLGLGVQADQIMMAVDALRMRDLVPLLHGIDDPRAHPTRETVRWVAERLTIAAGIIIELMEDAEITGSAGAIERARKLLDELGIICTD